MPPAGAGPGPARSAAPGMRPTHSPGLGRCALAAGHAAEAEGRLRQAVEIFWRIGAAEAADISRELGALIKTGPAGHRSRRPNTVSASPDTATSAVVQTLLAAAAKPDPKTSPQPPSGGSGSPAPGRN